MPVPATPGERHCQPSQWTRRWLRPDTPACPARIRCARSGTQPACSRPGDWKLIHYYQDGRWELYNLNDDIGESHDLAGRLPEKAAAMKARLDAMLRAQGAKIPSRDLYGR